MPPLTVECPDVQVRAGEAVTNTDIARFASLFNDELTLDNLERVQLQSLLTVSMSHRCSLLFAVTYDYGDKGIGAGEDS